MAKQKKFEDPLEGIDPVMQSAFASSDESPKFQDIHFDSQEEAVEEPGAPAISDVQFPALNQEQTGKKVEGDVFSNIPVSLSVELGRSEISLKEVFELSEGSIIELERLVGEPLDLVVNGQIIAQGEVVAIDNNYGLRVTNIIANA